MVGYPWSTVVRLCLALVFLGHAYWPSSHRLLLDPVSTGWLWFVCSKALVRLAIFSFFDRMVDYIAMQNSRCPPGRLILNWPQFWNRPGSKYKSYSSFRIYFYFFNEHVRAILKNVKIELGLISIIALKVMRLQVLNCIYIYRE